MSAQDHYDYVIIGAGQAGDPLARATAKSGKRTALIEKAAVGGTCVNYGCTPTKTMVASARAAYVTRRGATFGVETPPPSIDMRKIRERKRAIVESFRSGTEKHLGEFDNLDLIYGKAEFLSAKRIKVTGDGADRILTAETVVINAGARPGKADIAGIDDIPYLDSTSIMELDTVPGHLAILGGGYIAVEFAQLFRRLGSHVTIIQRGKQLLGHEDEDVAKGVADVLTEDGIDIRFESTGKSVAKTASGIRLSIQSAAGDATIDATHLLVATGRVPNTDDLGVAAAGIDLDKHGNIVANSRLETSAPGVYVLGDIKGGPAFTHISYDDYRVLRKRLVDGEDATIEGRLVPYTVFIDPQLGRVGLGETEARKAGRNIKVANMPMSYVARALEIEETRGFVKAVIDADTDQILGCSVLGYEGGELMAIVEVAMMGKLPYTALRDGIFAHPTSAELFNNLFKDM